MMAAEALDLIQGLWQGHAWAALRWTPLALAAIALTRLFRGSPRDGRFLLVATLMALPALPFAAALVPSWPLPDWRAAAGIETEAPLAVARQDQRVVPAEAVAPGVYPEASFGGAAWLAGLWLFAAAGLLARQLLARLRGWAIRRGASEAPERLRRMAVSAAESLGTPALDVRLASVSVPVLSGALRPVILLPPEAIAWPEDRLEAALLHELSHARQGDPWVEMASSATAALFWFHPAVWWLRRRLRHEMELLADASAVSSGLGPRAYGRALVDIAAGARHPLESLQPDLAMARLGGLERRLLALLEPCRRAPRALRGLVIGGGFLATLAVAGAATSSVSAWLEQTEGGWRLRCDGDALCGDVQLQAEELLREVGKPGVVVVQDVRSGELVAYAAQGPAPVPVVPPASVAKLTLAALWWEADLGTRALPCKKHWIGEGGVELQAVRERASLDVPRQMLTTSCTTAAGAMVEILQKERPELPLGARLAELGFADRAETPWLPDWLPASRLEPGAAWESHRPEMATFVGRVATTPLHVASLLQTVGADGVRRPTTRPRGASEGEGERVFSERTAQLMRAAMAEAVTDGTGHRAARRLEGSPWKLLGKTGTRSRDDGTYDGWFGGLVADADGKARYAIVVFVDGGGMGSEAPALAAADMTRFLAERL